MNSPGLELLIAEIQSSSTYTKYMKWFTHSHWCRIVQLIVSHAGSCLSESMTKYNDLEILVCFLQIYTSVIILWYLLILSCYRKTRLLPTPHGERLYDGPILMKIILSKNFDCLINQPSSDVLNKKKRYLEQLWSIDF